MKILSDIVRSKFKEKFGKEYLRQIKRRLEYFYNADPEKLTFEELIEYLGFKDAEGMLEED